MARFNEILVGRYNRFLQKLFSMKGGPVAAQLASEVQSVFPFFNGTENRFLEGWDQFMQQNFVGAAVGNKSAVQYRNPVGSNVIVVVESILVFGVAVDQPLLFGGTTSVDLTTPLSAVRPIDSRSKRISSTAIGSLTNAVVSPSLPMSMKQVAFAANGTVDMVLFEEQEVPISPGDALMVASNVANQGLNVHFKWRERFIEDSERF